MAVLFDEVFATNKTSPRRFNKICGAKVNLTYDVTGKQLYDVVALMADSINEGKTELVENLMGVTSKLLNC
ncbi:unnamed protein product [Clavelina lepadiformis]|uniref:Uncharacterized protein n=1 Tax=Clavelina lepadiformis TaxID=159417 RepID=A0ABP0G6N3_CLALP